MNDDRDDVIRRLERRLERERLARLEAEAIAERVTSDLYETVKELTRSTAEAELLGAVATMANEATEITSAMRGCITLVCAHKGWPVGHALGVAADGSGDLQSLGIWQLDDPDRYDGFRRTTEATRFPGGVGLPGRVLASGRPSWITSVALDPNFPRATAAKDAGLEAAFAFPVLVRSEVRAVFEFFSERVLSVDQALLRVMGQVGAQLGRLIERDEAELRLVHQATHDALTGLPNRSLLSDRIGQALVRAERSGMPVYVMFLDVDDFKTINDSLGHTAGDNVLVRVGARLQGCLRRADTIARTAPGGPATATVARLGGDEFAVLLENCLDPTIVAKRILQALREPLPIEGREVFAAVSIGMARSTDCALRAEELLRAADLAMHLAKSRGKNRFEMFEPGMREAVQKRHELADDLRRAVDGNQLRLLYQPEVLLETGAIVGVEALVRWEHPVLGMMPPDRFIPLAEETGLIIEIGAWVVEEACRQGAEWQRHARLDQLVMSVNLSGRQLRDDDIVWVVARVLAATGFPGERLCFEVTESVLMDNADTAAAVLVGLKTLGVSIAVDDFGTGYSSLSALKRYPVDYLKIDRSFVAGLPEDEDAGTIVWAVVRLGQSLNLKVVAEGVETEAQLAEIRRYSCDLAQGYLFGRPLPPGDVEVAVIEDRRW